MVRWWMLLGMGLLTINGLEGGVAADFRVHYNLPTTEIAVGRPFKLDLDLTYPNGYRPDQTAIRTALSQQGEPLPAPFVVLKAEASTPTDGVAGEQRLRLSYELLPQHVGTTTLLLMIPLHNPAATPSLQKIYAPPLIIDIAARPDPEHPDSWAAALLEPKEGPTPVEVDPVRVRQQAIDQASEQHWQVIQKLVDSHIAPWKQTAVVLACLMLMLLVLRPRRAAAEATFQLHWPALSPSRQAQRALRRLHRYDQTKAMPPKAFYNQLEAIMRKYLQAINPQLDASYTAEEIACTLPDQSNLHTFLKACTAGKFDHTADTPQQRQKTLTLAQSYLQQTSS